MGASASSFAGLTVLLLLLPALVAALHCDSLRHHQQMLNSQILGLLRQGGSNIPPECLAPMAAFNFPAKQLRVRESQLARRAAYELLKGFLSLFSSNLVQTGWATTDHERFLNALSAQSQRIKRCLKEEKAQRPEERRNKLILQRYFKGIRTFLEEKSRSPCPGILVVQLGVRTCLTYLDMLSNGMNS